MKYKFCNNEYIIEKDENNIFNYDELNEKITSYFEEYDYILGDMSYGKIRLKGFCKENNKLKKKINDYNMIDNYLKEYCSYNCSYFILKKVSKQNINKN